MNHWNYLLNALNNRETALLIWIAFIILVLLFTNVIKSLFPIFRLLATRKIIVLFLLIGTYLFMIIQVLKYLDIWQTGHMKDVLFWLFSIGLILVFKINEAKENAYFKGIFLSAIKWTVVLEFIINLYSFSLLTEILIVPVLFILAGTQAVADRDKKNKDVSLFLQYFIGLIVLAILIYSAYNTIINFESKLSTQTLIAFLLPTTITISFIPFVYVLALYVNYEDYFVHLSFITRDKKKVRIVKRNIIKTANINLDTLMRIRRNFDKVVFYDGTELKEYISQISRRNKNDLS